MVSFFTPCFLFERISLLGVAIQPRLNMTAITLDRLASHRTMLDRDDFNLAIAQRNAGGEVGENLLIENLNH